MKRIDLSVFGAIEVIDIVALYGLVEKRQPQSQDKQRDDQEFPAQEIKIPGAAPLFDGRMSTSVMRDDDLDRELRAHLDLEADELRESGLNAEDARLAARRTLGNTTLLKEVIREMSSWTSFERLSQDLRYGIRLLRRSPGFSAVAILTLALGIGANTAIFSVVDAFLLRPLPFRDSNRLVRFWPANTKTGLLPYSVDTYPNFVDWKAQARSFDQIELYNTRSFNLTGADQPERVRGLYASAGLFQLLGVNPMLGRTFGPEEIVPGRDHVVLLNEALWQRRFGRDPGVLGRTVKLNGENFVVIGILPASFQFPPDEPSEIALPQPPDPDRGHGFIDVAGRLKRGVSFARAQAEMDTIERRLELQYPNTNKNAGVRLMSLRDSFSKDFRPALLVFLSAVAFVLLIACANVANLFLARAAGRQKELVVRAAMGAGRLRLMRQLITESALLGLAGGGVGLLFAFWGVKGLVLLVGSTFQTKAINTVSIDARVLVFAIALSLVVGIGAGLAPAWGTAKLDIHDALKDGSRGLTSNRRRNRLRSALVVAEIALALVLLAGAGLMIKTFVLLNRVDSGVRTDNVLVLELALNGTKYAKTQARAPFVSAVLNRVEQLPNVASAAVVTDPPLSGSEDSLSFSIERLPDLTPDKKIGLHVNVVGPGYLRTLGIPLLKGRDFTERDSQATPLIALINRAMAQKLWPNQDPIGARISSDRKNWATIQGVVGNVHQQNLGAEPYPEVYLSYLQDPFAWPYLTLLVHTTEDPTKLAPSIQSAIWSVEKDLPIPSVRTLDQLRSRSIAQPRLTALLLAVFAALALFLASVGFTASWPTRSPSAPMNWACAWPSALDAHRFCEWWSARG